MHHLGVLGCCGSTALNPNPETCGREVASLRLGACGAGLAQLALLYALGVLGALCAYAGYAVFALLVQARPYSDGRSCLHGSEKRRRAYITLKSPSHQPLITNVNCVPTLRLPNAP